MSDYEEFYIIFRDREGVPSAVGAGVAVIVHDLDTDTYLDELTTDGDGRIAAGTLSVDPGTRVSFRIENYLGLAGSVVQITS